MIVHDYNTYSIQYTTYNIQYIRSIQSTHAYEYEYSHHNHNHHRQLITSTHTGITSPPHQLLLLPRTPLLIRHQLRLQAKLTYIPPLLLEVLAELQVLSDDRVLADMRDEEYR